MGTRICMVLRSRYNYIHSMVGSERELTCFLHLTVDGEIVDPVKFCRNIISLLWRGGKGGRGIFPQSCILTHPRSPLAPQLPLKLPSTPPLNSPPQLPRSTPPLTSYIPNFVIYICYAGARREVFLLILFILFI